MKWGSLAVEVGVTESEMVAAVEQTETLGDACRMVLRGQGLLMQQVHRFVCSVATGVEEATPLPAAATGGVPGSLMRLPLGKRHPFPLPRSAIGRGCLTKNFPSLFVSRGFVARLDCHQEAFLEAPCWLCVGWLVP
jgi:hypothetical protein